MCRMLIAAALLFVACGPRTPVAADETLQDIHGMIEEMMENMSANHPKFLDSIKAFMTENIVERLDNIEEMIESVQERQKYFEVCLNAFPCGEHGTCSVEKDTYKCTCKDGFSGEHCEAGDACLDVECLNGGTCYSTGSNYTGEYQCICNGTWYGDHCEMQGPCAEALAEQQDSGPEDMPNCEADGFYAPVQFRHGEAYCVTMEGEAIPGFTMKRRFVTENTTCQCARDKFAANEEQDGRQISCSRNGDYAPFVCRRRKCYCQNLYGEIDFGSGVPRRLFRRKLKCPRMN